MVSLIYITYYKQILSHLADSYQYAVEISLISGTIREKNSHHNPLHIIIFVFLQKKKYAVMNNEMIETIREYFKTQPVLKAWLFGSYARGEETPESDVDILVVYDDSKPVGLMKIANMYVNLKKLLNREVDLVEEGTLLPFAVESANRDKKLIYERAS